VRVVSGSGAGFGFSIAPLQGLLVAIKHFTLCAAKYIPRRLAPRKPNIRRTLCAACAERGCRTPTISIAIIGVLNLVNTPQACRMLERWINSRCAVRIAALRLSCSVSIPPASLAQGELRGSLERLTSNRANHFANSVDSRNMMQSISRRRGKWPRLFGTNALRVKP
jgi:hypothetical protein